MNLGNETTIERTILLDGTIRATPERAKQWTMPLMWFGVALVTAVGSLGFFPELSELWTTWKADPLRSIGMLIPPVSILLTLRVWKQLGWERKGAWSGLALIGLAFGISALRREILVIGNVGKATVSFLPTSSTVFFYWAGIIVLFAGWRVARRACFPILLMLAAQPVPNGLNVIDLELQSASAHVARGFATLIGFAPTTPALRLMFSPDFGMFIAPGCDGIRGAVAMGYVALILLHLKRAPLLKWILYVSGAVVLGYLFNFVRLCLLVVYYRIALGHSWLEHIAKQADYVIGSCLFLIATLLFVFAARQETDKEVVASPESRSIRNAPNMRGILWKGAAFAASVALVVSLHAKDLRMRWNSSDQIALSSTLMPKQVGDFTLSRTWYQQMGGVARVESAAYFGPGSSEIVLGVWLGREAYAHNSQECWMRRGLQSEEHMPMTLPTARGKSVPFDVGFYTDGNSRTIVATALCSPGSCTEYPSTPWDHNKLVGLYLKRNNTESIPGERGRSVPIIVRIDDPVTATPKSAAYQNLSVELRRFVSGLDLTQLSWEYQ